jgi:hypothetical protein
MTTSIDLMKECLTLIHNVNATFVPSNDSANAMSVSLCQRLSAHIARESALQAMTDDAQAMGLYDMPAPAGETRMIEVGPSFDALLTALERAECKGYLPDAIAAEWDAFDYSPVHAAPPSVPAVPTGWIACSERLPEIGEDVLLWCGWMMTGMLCAGGGYWDEAGVNPIHHVTHWHSLPTPPKGE